MKLMLFLDDWLLESKDGVNWRSAGKSLKVFPNQQFPNEQTWFYDKWETALGSEYHHNPQVSRLRCCSGVKCSDLLLDSGYVSSGGG